MALPLPGVGVLGTGFTAKAIIHLLKSSGFPVKALWGRTEDEAKKLAELLDIPFYTSHIDDLLLHQHVDLVCINSPPFLQSEIAVKTLGIGKNVLCERPAGLGIDDTKRMLSAARYYPSLMSLMTYYLRFLPTFCEMKKKIASGSIGDVMIIEMRVRSGVALDINFDWSHDSRMGGGVLTTFGGHFIDLVSYITGQQAIKVHGFLTTFRKHTSKVAGFREITSDDFCSFEMQLDKNAYCTCVINNNVPGYFSYEVMAIGSKASLLVKDGTLYGQDTAAGRHSGLQVVLTVDDQTIPSSFKSIFPQEVLEQIPKPFVYGLLKLIESLKASFTDKEDRRRWEKNSISGAATFEDALYVQTVLESIRRSSQTSYWEQVKVPSDT